MLLSMMDCGIVCRRSMVVVVGSKRHFESIPSSSRIRCHRRGKHIGNNVGIVSPNNRDVAWRRQTMAYQQFGHETIHRFQLCYCFVFCRFVVANFLFGVVVHASGEVWIERVGFLLCVLFCSSSRVMRLLRLSSCRQNGYVATQHVTNVVVDATVCA